MRELWSAGGSRPGCCGKSCAGAFGGALFGWGVGEERGRPVPGTCLSRGCPGGVNSSGWSAGAAGKPWASAGCAGPCEVGRTRSRCICEKRQESHFMGKSCLTLWVNRQRNSAGIGRLQRDGRSRRACGSVIVPWAGPPWQHVRSVACRCGRSPRPVCGRCGERPRGRCGGLPGVPSTRPGGRR